MGPPLQIKPDLGRLRPAVLVGLGFRLNGGGGGQTVYKSGYVKSYRAAMGAQPGAFCSSGQSRGTQLFKSHFKRERTVSDVELLLQNYWRSRETEAGYGAGGACVG